MALQSGTQYTFSDATAQTTGAQKMSVEDIIRSQDVRDLPLKNFLGYDGFIGTNPKYEFIENNHPAISSTLGTAGWNTADDTTDLAVADATVFVKGDVVLTAKGEIVIVSAVDEINNDIDVLARGKIPRLPLN